MSSLTEIDLHGMRLDEAEREVMRFVDQLYYNSEGSGRIVHGFGAIAEKLPQWLSSYPYVKRFERSTFNAGVTMVYMNLV